MSLLHPQSTLLAVPIPSEHASRGDDVQKAVEQAVRESIEQGVDRRGKEVTPWLLSRVGELTGGVALDLSVFVGTARAEKADVKLIENNARVGAEVARELVKLQRQRDEQVSWGV